jgi:DNA polymerase-4
MLRAALENIADIVWERVEKASANGRTVSLKLRTADFATLTRAKSVARPVSSRAEFAALGHTMLDELLPLPQPVRLMGLTLSALESPGETAPHPEDGQLKLL